MVRTSGFQPGDRGSIPLWATKFNKMKRNIIILIIILIAIILAGRFDTEMLNMGFIH